MASFLSPKFGMQIVLTQAHDLRLNYHGEINELKRLSRIPGLGISVNRLKAEYDFHGKVYASLYHLPPQERTEDLFYAAFLDALEGSNVFSEGRKDALRAKVAARVGKFNLVAYELVNLPVGTTMRFMNSETWSFDDGRQGASAIVQLGGELDIHVRDALHGPKTGTFRVYGACLDALQFDVV